MGCVFYNVYKARVTHVYAQMPLKVPDFSFMSSTIYVWRISVTKLHSFNKF